MEPDVILKNFNSTFATWEKELNNYSLEQLCKKPNPESWSLGEPYIHLMGQTLYYNIEQIKICISTNENENGEKSAEGKEVFLHNSFPDQKIKAPSPEFETVHQPNSIEEIREALSHIKNLMTELESKIEKSPFKGKTKHPGLHYLNAGEWYQFIEMHFRHHLRQKERIDLLAMPHLLMKGLLS